MEAKRAIVLKHAAFEGPGRLAPLLVARGYRLELRELDRGDPVPDRTAPGELLVVMGGPMGVGDIDRAELGFLGRELELLARCLDDDVAVIGVCLGAQLLAAAAGARVAPMVDGRGARCYEVGWAEVRFHAHDDADALLRRLPATAQVLHWHGDACELPAGARRLASSELCANQAFQIGTRQVGLQFHCEVDGEDVEAFLHADGDFAVRANGRDAVAQIRSDTRDHMAPFLALGDRLLRNVLDVIT
jgi:GMP synthase (glutamine-hydrolysing)